MVPGGPIKIIWDKTKPSGDKMRKMSTKRPQSINIRPTTKLEEGIRRTINWYLKNKEKPSDRFNSFTEKN